MGVKNIQQASSKKQKEGTPMALSVEKWIIITVATNKELSNEHYYRRLWMAIKNLMSIHGFSRRGWVDFCINYFRDKDGIVKLQWANDMPYVLPDWDTWFSDPDARWLSYYLQECNGIPKIHSHLYSRLRVFDAVIRAKWPSIAMRIQA